MMKISWKTEQVPPEFRNMLRTLADEYPVEENGEGLPVEIRRTPGNGLAVERRNGGFAIECGTVSAAARGVAHALAGTECRERREFETFGILLDCSRTGIVTVEHFKHWLRRLALLGYNLAMLYTKDAYQVEGEPYFGYMRGAYSREEIREIDAYAAALGIEMCASIQALGHLEPVLRWRAYAEVRDTDNVILADDPAGYRLLEKMIGFWSDALGSRRIHLGMDETHDLGRGRFLDRNGYERGFDIYNRHLGRVCAIAEKYELKPMIWSDMYFRMGNANQDYYDPATVIPPDVAASIAPAAQLWYWDYYHRNEAFYADWIRRHREIGKEPVMASGLWTWSRLWYDHEISVATVAPCMDACRKSGVKEIVFTMWGDDGGYCEFDSAFAGLAWAADYAGNPASSAERISTLFAAVCGASWEMQILPGTMQRYSDGTEISAPAVLWDDPLMGIVWHEGLHHGPGTWDGYIAHLESLRIRIEPFRGDCQAGNLEYAWRLCTLLIEKLRFRRLLADGCRAGDRAALSGIPERIPGVIAAIDAVQESFREQWFRSFKPWGLEIMQIRLAGLAERYRETGRRIQAYLDGKALVPEELVISPQTIGSTDPRYRMIATGGWFI